MATGNGGQYIMVFPGLDMLAVFTGGAYNSQEDKLPFAIMKDVFLATFMKKKKEIATRKSNEVNLNMGIFGIFIDKVKNFYQHVEL